MQQSPSWSRVRAALPYVLAATFTAFIGCVSWRHEMWRDELQAWLLARDSTTPLQLLHNLRYEGHPGLWHLLLWPLAQLSPNPVSMQVLHVALAGASALLVFRCAPFSWSVKLLLMLGYFFAYEWAVIARNYAISGLLLFAICALYERRWRRFPLIATLLFLLCHTNIFSILLVIVFAVTLSIEFAVAYAGRYRDAERCLGRFLAGMVIIALGLYTGIRQIIPPKDSGFAEGWHWHWSPGDGDRLGGIIVRAYLPVPIGQLHFWNTDRFLDQPDGPRTAAPLLSQNRFAAGLLILALGSLFFLKRPWLLAPYWLGSVALLTFFQVKITGEARHHGFLFLLFVTLLWQSAAYRPWKTRWRSLEWLSSFWDRHRMKALIPALGVQVWATAVAVQVDWQAPFSEAKAVARWITTEFADRSQFVFVGDSSPAASGVAGYLGLKQIYYPDRGDFGSYVIWDQQRLHRGQPFNQQITELTNKTEKDAILILDHELGKTTGSEPPVLLTHLGGAVVRDENFWIYRWPCAKK